MWIQGRQTKKQVLQDLDISGRQNGQECRRTLSAEPRKKWAEEKNKIGRSERATRHLLYSGRRS